MGLGIKYFCTSDIAETVLQDSEEARRVPSSESLALTRSKA